MEDCNCGSSFSGCAPQLTQLYLYLSASCNLACRHCWILTDEAGPTASPISCDEFIEIAKQAVPLRLQRVKLTGGEPLLHPQTVELLYGFSEMKLEMSIETNGTLIGPKEAKALADTGCFAALSLDGPDAETHEDLRGVVGCFDQLMEGVRHIKDAGGRFQFISCLYRGNVDRLIDTIRLAASLGASSVKINPTTPTARAKEMNENDELLSVREILEARARLLDELSSEEQRFVFFDVPPVFHSITSLRRNPGAVCGIHSILGVLSDGSAALCGIGNHVPELNFGNILDVGLEKIWINNPVLKSIREKCPDELGEPCGSCMLKRHCLGKCLAHNYVQTGDLFAGFSFCKTALEEGLFPVNRLSRGKGKVK